MSSSLFAILVALLVCSAQVAAQCQVIKGAAFWAGASEDEIIAATTNGNRIGGCYIQDNRASSTGACDLYAKSAIMGVNGDRGWPKTTGMMGTGCVRGPDLSPRGVTTCFYTASGYALPASLVATFCTGDGFSNAVAQIRHAIKNDACDLSGRPEKCQKGKRGCVCAVPDIKQQLKMCKRQLAATKRALKKTARALKNCRKSCK